MTTYDVDGTSLIDSGYNVSTVMKEVSAITSFTVEPSNTINGKLNTYTFTITTPAKILDGDVLKFTVPDQVTLPATIEELNI